MSSLRVRQANCSVVCCINQHKCLNSVPATGEQKRHLLRLIFNDNVPATLPVSLYVCDNHFTSSVPRVSTKLALPLHWFTVAYEYGEVSWKLASLVSCASVCYATAFEVSLMLLILRGSLVVTVKVWKRADCRQRWCEQFFDLFDLDSYSYVFKYGELDFVN